MFTWAGHSTAAHLAVNAQIGHGAHFIGSQSCRIDVRLEKLSHKVGLSAGRSGFLMGCSKYRTHVQGRRFGAALAAAVAAGSLGHGLAGLPVELELGGRIGVSPSPVGSRLNF